MYIYIYIYIYIYLLMLKNGGKMQYLNVNHKINIVYYAIFLLTIYLFIDN